MENEDNKSMFENKYKEVKISKMVVNGKEQTGNVIDAVDTKNNQELNITVYTQQE